MDQSNPCCLTPRQSLTWVAKNMVSRTPAYSLFLHLGMFSLYTRVKSVLLCRYVLLQRYAREKAAVKKRLCARCSLSRPVKREAVYPLYTTAENRRSSPECKTRLVRTAHLESRITRWVLFRSEIQVQDTVFASVQSEVTMTIVTEYCNAHTGINGDRYQSNTRENPDCHTELF